MGEDGIHAPSMAGAAGGRNRALPRSTLVLGGARSGKTAHALALCEDSGLALVYCATAGEARDAEMAERIARHRAERDARWRTCEAPRDLAPALAASSGPGAVLLVDCLTLWLTNVLLGGGDTVAAQQELVAALGALPGPVVLVSNEVGLGIVPDNALARRFRDAQGRLNQAVAAACDRVVFIAAGLPLTLKDAGVTPLRRSPAARHTGALEEP